MVHEDKYVDSRKYLAGLRFVRRAFIELIEQKGWEDAYLLLYEQQIELH